VVESWTKVPILLHFEWIVNGSNFNNLSEVTMLALMKGGGLIKENVFWCK
jgi:hypothetical protein